MNLELKHITKYFDKQLVLNDVCFEEEITSLAVIGPSGGGKSTMLRIIGGLIPPTNGSLYIDNKEITFDKESLLEYHKQIGFVFQANGLFEHFTASENVTLPLMQTCKISKKEALKTSDELFERFGLYEERDKYPVQLSGGQQQRVSIARAIAMKPSLILLDEPTSALDPEYTTEVLDMLRELQKEGLKTIIVTHEMGFAKNACDMVVFLDKQKIIEASNSDDFFKHPKTPELKQFLDMVLEWKI
ncbi:MAG: amino acid ABC transporter ATP-binding protein [Caldisericia bacterium]|nr:amino acid ABC transporter ATP-binding protein [Caldisericia bacterium]